MGDDRVETHLSVLTFVGDRVYKTKKPLDFGFVDYRTRPARQKACELEVSLNRRLAPDVYLGVTEIAGPGGEAEPAVVMRRLPADRSLAALVARADVQVPTALREVARQLADFHSRCHVYSEPDSPGCIEHVRRMWLRECDEIVSLAADLFDVDVVTRLRELGSKYLLGRAPLFADRIADRFVRDGHGDLQAADIFLLPDGPRVIDCLEFDPQLRIGDVLLDVAFLAMDLERLGAAAGADTFIAAYQEYSAEVHPRSLFHFYVAYRALVRAKVSAIRFHQGDAAMDAQVRSLVALCAQHAKSGQIRLMCVGGLPGSGKTTVALGLANVFDAEYLSSDEIRDEGRTGPVRHPDPVPWGTGPYSARATAAVYEEIRRRARTALGRGMSVVLDASWHDERERRLVEELAQDTHATLSKLCCVVDDGLAEHRLKARRTGSSDANVDVRRAMRDRFDSWDGAVTINTGGSPTAGTGRAIDGVLGAGAL